MPEKIRETSACFSANLTLLGGSLKLFNYVGKTRLDVLGVGKIDTNLSDLTRVLGPNVGSFLEGKWDLAW